MTKKDRPKGKSTTNPLMAKLNQFKSQQQARTNEDSHAGDVNPTQSNSSADSETNERKTRGPTLCKDIWTSSKKIKVRLNTKGQPIGNGANSIKSFLGTIARNGRLLPLTFSDWRKIPKIAKEDAWEEVLARFRIGLAGKVWFRKSLAKKWKDWKAELKAAYYDSEAPYEVNVMNREPRVSEDQWRVLINYWMSDEGKKRSEINKANRTKLKIKHTCGSRSSAQIREDERVKRPDKKEPSRAEMFIITHKRKNGDVVDKKSAKIISKLEERISEQPEHFSDPVATDDIYGQVMGCEKNGYMRTFGIGPIPSDFWGALPSRAEALRMAAEAQETAKKEVSKMCSELKAMKKNAKKQHALQERLLSFIKSKFPESDLDAFLSIEEVSNVQSPQPLSPLHVAQSTSDNHIPSCQNPSITNRKRMLNHTNDMQEILRAKKSTRDENTNEEVRSPKICMRDNVEDVGKKKPFQDISTTVMDTHNLDHNNQKVVSRSVLPNNSFHAIEKRKSPQEIAMMRSMPREDMHIPAMMKTVLNTNQTKPAQDRPAMKKNTRHEAENRVFLLGTKKPYPAVAQGNVISKCATTKVGDIEIGPLFWEIYVDTPIISNQILPRPYGRYHKIGDCAGATIAWPNFLVKAKPDI